jgi:5'-nucleotidase
MDILLTNDDGVHAPGLLALREALARLGEVTVAAPAHERSAVSHALSLNRPIPEPRRVPLRGRGTVVAIDGTPVDCIKFALDRVCRARPGLVVSGINPGLNTGINILYSGTVGGAAEGAFAGIPSVAVSLEASAAMDFRAAARRAARFIRAARAKGLLRPGVFLNLNLPARPRPLGVRWTVMDRGPLAEAYVRRADPRGRAYYWLKGPEDEAAPAAVPSANGRTLTDNAAIRAGFVSVTPLQFDLTDRRLLKRFSARKF